MPKAENVFFAYFGGFKFKKNEIRNFILYIRKVFRIFIPMKEKVTLLTWMAVNNDPMF